MFIILTSVTKWILMNKMNELVTNMYFLYQYNYLVLIQNYVNHILHTFSTLIIQCLFFHYEKIIPI